MSTQLKSLFAGVLAFAAVPAFGLVINEIRIDQPDFPDDEEYVELKGTPGESLDGVWFLYIGDHSGDGDFAGSGVVELALDLTGFSIGDDGLFLMIGPNFDGDAFGITGGDVDYLYENFGQALENSDNTTALLVSNFSGNGGNEIRGINDQQGELAVDIDISEDGIPNTEEEGGLPWDSVIDAVGLVETTSSGEFNYGEALGFVDIGPDGQFVPSHLYRASDTDEWLIGQYVVFETDSNDNIIGLNPDGSDTPGTVNPLAPPPTVTPSIASLSTIFADVGEVIEVTGENMQYVEDATVGGVTALFNWNATDSVLEVTVPEGASTGELELSNVDGSATSANLIVILDTADAVLVEDFSGGLAGSGFQATSVASDADWGDNSFRDSFSIEINGFGADAASDDWLISPTLDLSALTSAYLVMGHERVFGGPALEVKVSTDPNARANPQGVVWTDLSVTLAGDGAEEIVHSGIVDISSYIDSSVTVAIRYTTVGTGPGEGAIDRIHYMVIGGEAAETGYSDDPNFGLTANAGNGWSYSLEFGWIATGDFPWFYQGKYGFMYHYLRAAGVGTWLWSPELGWILVEEGARDFYYNNGGADWMKDDFLMPGDD